MQTVQTADILTIAACLAAETLRVCTVLDRQLGLVKNDIAVDVRHRNLSGRNEIEVVHLAVVHLTFLVGQLSRAIT